MRLRKQSQTAQPLQFLMVDSADHISPKTGLTPTVTLSKNGGAFASPAGAVTEIGNGWYKVAGNATDTNTLGPLILHATASGADPVDAEFAVVAFDPQDSVRLGLTALPNAIAAAAGGLLTRGTSSGQVEPSGGKVVATVAPGDFQAMERQELQATFTGSSGTDLASATGNPGVVWTNATPSAGTLVLDGNDRLMINGAGGSALMLYLVAPAPPSADYAVRARITQVDGSGRFALVARGIDANNHYRLDYNPAVGQGFFITKVVGGVSTVIGNYPSLTIATGASKVVSLHVVGDRIWATIDGVKLPEITDSGLTAAGYAGLRSRADSVGSPTTGLRISEFQVFTPAAVLTAERVWDRTLDALTSVPAITAKVKDALAWLFTLARNRRTQTSSTETVYRDDGATSLATSAKTDDGTTYSSGEFS